MDIKPLSKEKERWEKFKEEFRRLEEKHQCIYMSTCPQCNSGNIKFKYGAYHCLACGLKYLPEEYPPLIPAEEIWELVKKIESSE